MVFTPNLSVQQWVELPSPTRLRLAVMFDVKRSSGSVVENGRLITDGHTYEDLKAISVKAMQDLLVTKDSDYFGLLDKVLAMVEEENMAKEKAALRKEEELAEVEAQKEEDMAVKAIAEMTNIVAKKRGRKPKNK